jgi:acetolactate decarboxylase
MPLKLLLILFHILTIGNIGGEDPIFKHHQVNIEGAMHNVIKLGELKAVICTDTLPKKHLYGMGPIENLRGEITIFDGIVYTAGIGSSGALEVGENKSACAPFLGWSHIPIWREYPLPDSIITNLMLQNFLEREQLNAGRAFFFRLSGRLTDAAIHVLNLPPGTKVEVPSDARKRQFNQRTGNIEADILGFFSTAHQRVFTHHDSFLHLHLLSKDRLLMGHADELRFSKGSLRLFVPEY